MILRTSPPNYLTLDEIFSRIGSEKFASKWTGKEFVAVTALPVDYWRPEEEFPWFGVPPSDDWLSASAPEDPGEDPIYRYKEVAKSIVYSSLAGKYLVFLTYIGGEITAIDRQNIGRDTFKSMIYHPQTPHRERLRFIVEAKGAERLRASSIEDAGEEWKLTKRAIRSQKKQQMYDVWLELVDEYRFR